MVVRRFSIAEVVPVYVCLFPFVFLDLPHICPNPAIRSQPLLGHFYSLRNPNSAPNHCLVTRLFAPQRPTQDAEDRERERESRREN